jgi:pyrimidine operon attenuation protein/uracil phosphoribosyltransferase
MESRSHVLTHTQIKHKIKRIAYQIYENNLDGGSLFVGGIGDRGGFLSRAIVAELRGLSSMEVFDFGILAIANHPPSITIDSSMIKGAKVVIVDDVLNTGKTLMDVIVMIFGLAPSGIETCFLAQRSHRRYPVVGDYVGIKMATTFQEHIFFDPSDPDSLQLYIE